MVVTSTFLVISPAVEEGVTERLLGLDVLG